MKILFAASECVPFVKTGGLADVIGSLPQSVAAILAKSGGRTRRRTKDTQQRLQVIIVLPKYSLMERDNFSLHLMPGRILIPVGDGVEEGMVWLLTDNKKSRLPDTVSVFFIENKKYFDRAGLYGSQNVDFPDNDERFTFFSRSILEFCKFIDFVPDVIHCHDWQTGLVPAYLSTLYQTDAFFSKTASVFTIHNIAYQGIFPKQSFFLTGLGWQDFTPDKLEYYDKVSFLKAGLVYADKISTVSPNYAREIQDSNESGKGMEGVLKSRRKDLKGILNGLDYTTWNPAKDPDIAARYSTKSKDFWTKKQKCKSDLQAAARLPAEPDVPLVGMVSRLDPQKGFNRLLEILPALFEDKVPMQWVILGIGDRGIQEKLGALSKRYPGQFSFNIGFLDDLAHKIYAGSDIYFMPSQFEPCGLGQMIAMKYGTVPVVTPTGGLLDTVDPWNPDTGTGTGFISTEITAPPIKKALLKAFKFYEDQTQWRKLARNAMGEEFSWDYSAQEYVKLYRSALEKIS